MSGSGWNTLIVNTRERAVSTDINRLQAFQQKSVAEALRWWMDVPVSLDDVYAGAVATEPASFPESPLRAEIFNGLMAKPQSGTSSVQVQPGACMVLSPDATADNSDYKLIEDVGVLANGVLVLAANGVASIRIDVVEFRINPVPNTVTDSRDIFNSTTGLFTAATVTKEVSGRLEYRVRQGTAGAGFPGLAAGWLPIAVASVKANWNGVDSDDVTFWDVRPLLDDREFGPSNLASNLANGLDLDVHPVSYADAQTDPAFQGNAVVKVNGRRLGGILRRGTPGSDAAVSIVVGSTVTDNISAGTTFASGALWYMYLLTPCGLPRWARYGDGPGTRTPRSPRGIPVVTVVAPNAHGKPGSAVAIPVSTGLGTSTNQGAVVLVGIGEAAGQPGVLTARGKMVRPLQRYVVAASSANNARSQYAMTPANYPPCCRSLYVEGLMLPNVAGGNYTMEPELQTYFSGFGALFRAEFSMLLGNATGPNQNAIMAWLPVPPVYPSETAPSFIIEHQYNLVGNTLLVSELRVRGFELY